MLTVKAGEDQAMEADEEVLIHEDEVHMVHEEGLEAEVTRAA